MVVVVMVLLTGELLRFLLLTRVVPVVVVVSVVSVLLPLPPSLLKITLICPRPLLDFLIDLS